MLNKSQEHFFLSIAKSNEEQKTSIYEIVYIYIWHFVNWNTVQKFTVWSEHVKVYQKNVNKYSTFQFARFSAFIDVQAYNSIFFFL